MFKGLTRQQIIQSSFILSKQGLSAKIMAEIIVNSLCYKYGTLFLTECL